MKYMSVYVCALLSCSQIFLCPKNAREPISLQGPFGHHLVASNHERVARDFFIAIVRSTHAMRKCADAGPVKIHHCHTMQVARAFRPEKKTTEAEAAEIVVVFK